MEKGQNFIYDNGYLVLKDLDYSIHKNPNYGSSERYEILQQDLNNVDQFYDVCCTFDLDIAIEVCRGLSMYKPGYKFYIWDCDYSLCTANIPENRSLYEYCGLDTVIKKEN